MNLKKTILSFMVTTAVAASMCSAYADGFYDATAESNQIKGFIADGLYLEAIRDSENTIAWHNLSPEDIAIFQGYKDDAENRYNEYLQRPAQKSYYNAAAEVNQIRSNINRGLYYEAIRDCENTIAWHELSPEDINIINDLKVTANTKLTGYLQSSNKDDWSEAYTGRSAEAEAAINDITNMWNGMIPGGSNQNGGEISETEARKIVQSAYAGAKIVSVANKQYNYNDCYCITIRMYMGRQKIERDVYVDKSSGRILNKVTL